MGIEKNARRRVGARLRPVLVTFGSVVIELLPDGAVRTGGAVEREFADLREFLTFIRSTRGGV